MQYINYYCKLIGLPHFHCIATMAAFDFGRVILSFLVHCIEGSNSQLLLDNFLLIKKYCFKPVFLF